MVSERDVLGTQVGGEERFGCVGWGRRPSPCGWCWDLRWKLVLGDGVGQGGEGMRVTVRGVCIGRRARHMSHCFCLHQNSRHWHALQPPLPTAPLPPTHTRLQLVRRNEELRLLYEKIKIQQFTLQRGQAQYRDRLNEIRVLKIKVRGEGVQCGVGCTRDSGR